jgi:hypothetical protein
MSNTSKPPATSASTYPSFPESDLRGVARTAFDSPNPTQAQLARRAKNNKAIREMGLPVLETLPVVEDEQQVKLRTPREAAERCLATTFCAIKAEMQDQQLVDDLIKQYAASHFLSPKERRFIENGAPSKQDQVDFSWQYECVHVFLWALQAHAALAKPDEICPVKDDMAAIKKIAPADFVAKARLRPAAEILDMADLYYRLDWAAVELRVKGQKSDRIDESIIRERHRALNWLIRYLNQDWDDVTTDT